MFWAIVWPDGHDVRRLRLVAVVGLALIGLGAVAETVVDWLTQGHAFAQLPAFGETVLEQSAVWLLLRLAALAAVGFFGAELLRRPVRGVRRIIVLTLVGLLTATLVVESTTMASPRVVAITTSTGGYLLALAAWLGGLVALAVLLVPHHRPIGLETIWNRFSWFAGLSVLALLATGTAQHLVVGGTATSRSGVLLVVEVLALAATLLLCRYAVAYGRRLAFRERYLRGFPVEESGRGPASGPRSASSWSCRWRWSAYRWPSSPCCRFRVDRARRCSATRRRPRPWRPPGRRDRSTATSGSSPSGSTCPGGASASVVPVATVGRELVVPEEPGKVGWWDGSSYVGDDYGSTVIAGHVDTLDQGIGFFFRLWHIEVGERVVLSAGNVRQAYTITTLRQVPRTDLVDDKEVFDIDGPPRLVLITCAGEFRPDRGGYSRNLVVVARPVS